MSNTRTMLATLALGAAFAFAGPAFADKMKVTLDGKAEVPPNTSAGKGTADLDYDPASKKLSWKTDLFRALRARHRGAFPRPGRSRRQRRRRRGDPQCRPRARSKAAPP